MGDVDERSVVICVCVYIDVPKVVSRTKYIPETSTSTTSFAGFNFALTCGFVFVFGFLSGVGGAISRCLPFPFDVDLDLVLGGFSVSESGSVIIKSQDRTNG